MRLGDDEDMPSGFRSLDELADHVRAISQATKHLLNDGPFTRRAIEILLMDAMPTPPRGVKKVGTKQLRYVLDSLAELEEFVLLEHQDDD